MKVWRNFSIFMLLAIMLVSTVSASFVISPSRVDYISNDNIVSGGSFLLSGITNFEGENTIFKTEITDSGISTSRNIDIKISDEKYECNYNFDVSETNYIWKLSIYPETKWTQKECEELELQSNEISYFAVKPTVLTKYRCVIATKVYSSGFLSKPTEHSEIKFSLGNGEETLFSETSTTNEISETEFKKNGITTGVIYWNDNIKIPDYCPSTSPTIQRAIEPIIDSNGIKLIDTTEYQNYKNNIDSVHDDVELYVSSGITAVNFDIQLQAILDKTNNIVDTFGTTNKLKATDGKYYDIIDSKIEFDRPFEFPVFDVRVNAHWLGAIIPVGAPRILSYTPEVVGFKSGIGKYLTITMKNIGDGVGIFKAEAKCEDDIITTSDIKTIESGDVSELKVLFNSNAVRDTSEKCEVKVYDVNTPTNVDFFDINAHVSAYIEFEDGMTTCVGDTLKISDKNSWLTKEECTDGCIMLTDESAECKISNNSEEKQFNLMFIIWGLVAGAILILIIVWGVGYAKK